VGPTRQGGGGGVTARAGRARGKRGGGWAATGPKAGGRGGELGRKPAGPEGWRGAHGGKGEEGGRLASWATREGEGAAGPKWEERGEERRKRFSFF
jgi:hypothetical protein